MFRRLVPLLGLLCGSVAAQDAGPVDPVTAARRWAVVIGNSDYDFLPDLKFARDDAKEVARVLVEEHGFTPDTVRLLTDDAEDEFQRPTRGYIMRELRGLLKDPRRMPSDLFVFYFSGHGVGREEGDFLLPKSADLDTLTDVGLNIREVVELLREEGVANALFVMDGCREGEENTPFGRWLLELPDEQRVAVLLSCEPGEQSLQSRRLGHGIFTWYFVEALRDPALYDPRSGALWASRVGAAVRDKVAEHTELEIVPQVPRVFVDDTRDVLLGTRIPPELDAAGIEEWAAQVGVSVRDPKLYMGAMGSYAEHLFLTDDLETCAAVLLAAAERGPLPPHLSYLLGASLIVLDRDREASRVIAALRQEHGDTYYGRLAAVQDLSGGTSDVERYAAALGMLEHDRPLPDEMVSDLAHVLLRGGAQADALRLIDELAASRPEGSRLRAYLGALCAVERGEVEEALAAFALAEPRVGPPSDELVWNDYSETLIRFGRSADAVAVLDRAVAARPDSGEWLVRRAWARTRTGDFVRARDEVRTALAQPLGAHQLLLAVRVLGADVRASADAIVAQAAAHPLAWEARVAEIVATKEGDEIGAALWDNKRYASSSLQIVIGAIEVLQDISRELEATGRMTHEEALDQDTRCLGELVRRAGELGQDAGGWNLVDSLSCRLGRYVQFRELCDRHLTPLAEAGGLPAGLTVVYGLTCLNTGDLARFRELLALFEPGSRYALDLAWFEVAYLASQRETAAARERLVELPGPPAGFEELDPVLRALLAAQEGDAEAAGRLLGSAPRGGALSDALAAQTLIRLGRPDLADPLVRASLQRYGSPFFFAEIVAIEMYATFSGDLTQIRDFAQRCARLYPGNPLVRKVRFVEEVDRAAYEGVLRLRFEDADGAGKVRLFIDADGTVEGSVALPSKRNFDVEGAIDEYGNLEATLVDDEASYRLFAKLAPPAVYAEYEGLQRDGQLLLVLDENGIALGWVARP